MGSGGGYLLSTVCESVCIHCMQPAGLTNNMLQGTSWRIHLLAANSHTVTNCSLGRSIASACCMGVRVCAAVDTDDHQYSRNNRLGAGPAPTATHGAVGDGLPSRSLHSFYPLSQGRNSVPVCSGSQLTS